MIARSRVVNHNTVPAIQSAMIQNIKMEIIISQSKRRRGTQDVLQTGLKKLLSYTTHLNIMDAVLRNACFTFN